MLEIKREILLNSIRWCSNILVEVLSAYASSVSEPGAEHLREAVRELSEAQTEFRKGS